MGRFCNGPRVLWAEFVMGRDVPEPEKMTEQATLNENVSENDLKYC